jgi:hypothetical protein
LPFIAKMDVAENQPTFGVEVMLIMENNIKKQKF